MAGWLSPECGADGGRAGRHTGGLPGRASTALRTRNKGRATSGWAAFGLGLLSFLLGASLGSAATQSEKGDSWLRHGQRALEEYRAKNYAAFLENVERAARAGPPRHPWLMYQLARAYSLNGRAAEGARLLGELADMGLGVDVAGDVDFASLRATAGWPELSKKIVAAREPFVRGRAAFVIPEPDLLPEGIAYDPRRRTFYLGSLIAVQNANPAPDRIVRLFLSADGRKAERARVLESNRPDYALPTTGVLVGDELFYVANTQIKQLGAGGQLAPGAKLRDLILLRLKIH